MTTILIDDLVDAVACLSDLGAAVVGPSVGAIRDALLQSSAVQQCPIVQHRAFATWASAQLAGADACISLDPLLPPDSSGARGIVVRVSRAATPAGLVLRGDVREQIPAWFAGGNVTIADDVASSGATLTAVVKAVRDAGGCITRVVLCTMTENARSAVGDLVPVDAWSTYVQRYVQALHARDACPFLPYGGKQFHNASDMQAHPLPVEVCLPVTAFQRGGWADIGMRRNLHHAITSARRAIVDRFDQALGRAATVGDLPLLGPSIRLPISARFLPDTKTPLNKLA